ncbi:hypothetical protein T484DRAFT_1785818 [Baffinella frigidus]|nr:hypothetical protein T484DRAFT_1785818 [Cryptophyta sp. CCMP2293]
MEQVKNVGDVGQMLNVAISYLEGMQGQLDEINSKLDAVATNVREIADGVRLLLGRPINSGHRH